MAKGDRRSNLFRLLTRPKRARRQAKIKSIHGYGVPGRITDALGATRAMRPEVVRPGGEGAGVPPPGGPELTIVHPPKAPRGPAEPHLQVGNRRLRFSLSYLACGTLGVTFFLLLLVAFVMGMRYQGGQSRLSGVARHGPDETTSDENAPGGKPPPIVEIPTRVVTPPTRTERYHLRIAVYTVSKRDLAEKSIATLRENGVAAVLTPRRIDGKEHLVVYSEQRFSSRSTPEAAALERKVKMIRHEGRYDFGSAYYVPVE